MSLVSEPAPPSWPNWRWQQQTRCRVPKSRDVIAVRRGGKNVMANMLHGSARTMPRARSRASQRSKEKTSALAQRYGLSRTTITKWRSRATTTNAPMGPSQPTSTVLSPAQEAVIVEFRRRTLLPLDDMMGCLRESIPKLSRSGLAPLSAQARHLTVASQRD
jgi:transposase-like protein